MKNMMHFRPNRAVLMDGYPLFDHQNNALRHPQFKNMKHQISQRIRAMASLYQSLHIVHFLLSTTLKVRV